MESATEPGNAIVKNLMVTYISFSRLAACTAVGTLLGICAYTFTYAKGYSYLVNNSDACANCHIMNEQYDGWLKSSHQQAAGCNDCHAPHGNVLAKYLNKAENGFRHSLMFTTGRFHEPIQIRKKNLDVTEAACRHCHTAMVDEMHPGDFAKSGDSAVSCTACHRSVGHLHLSD